MSSFSSTKPAIVVALVLIVCAAISSAALSASFAASNTETPEWSTLANLLLAAAGYCLVALVVVIAEGVETEDQWKILRLLKCGMAQGFYFSAALPPKDVEKLLHD